MLCSCHFEEYCFKADIKLVQSFGAEGKRNLDSSLMLFPHAFKNQRGLLVWMLLQPVKKRRVAFKKCERQRVSVVG